MNNPIYSRYPENDDTLYYIEYVKYEGKPKTWKLFRRNYMYSPEVWASMKHSAWDRNEVHPYNLGGGNVSENENAIDLNTPAFLTFMVDSLNKNSQQLK